MISLEKEQNVFGRTLFVFYQDDRKMFRFQTVPAGDSGFDNRCPIHKDYRGLRGEDLIKAAGVPDAEFVHAAGFIGGAWSMESCVKMAEASVAQHKLEYDEKEKNQAVEPDVEKKQKVEGQ